jgi:hypothetical protein
MIFEGVHCVLLLLVSWVQSFSAKIYIHLFWKCDEIKSTLNSGNACYHSVQDILSSVSYKKCED